MIRCRSCHKSKHRTQFYKACVNKAGSLGECKECVRERVRKNRKEKADYYREYDANRFQNDPRVKERHRRYRESEHGKAVISKCREQWAASNREKQRKSRAKWLSRNQDKYEAHNAVNNAVRDGKLIKPDRCQDCGAQAARLEGHHEDYTKPLEVIWLCRSCHVARHRDEVA